MRILSCNVCEENFSMSRLLQVLAEYDPDVVCAQEFYEKDFNLESYPYSYYCDEKDVCYKNYILSKTPLKRIGKRSVQTQGVAITNIHLSDTPYQPYQLAGLDYEDGYCEMKTTEGKCKKIDVGEVYKYSKIARKKGMEKLLEECKIISRDTNIHVVCGDFNEPSHIDTGLEYYCSKVMEKEGYKDIGLTEGETYHGITKDRIDYFYIKARDESILNDFRVRRINGNPSDHDFLLLENNFLINKMSEMENDTSARLTKLVEECKSNGSCRRRLSEDIIKKDGEEIKFEVVDDEDGDTISVRSGMSDDEDSSMSDRDREAARLEMESLYLLRESRPRRMSQRDEEAAEKLERQSMELLRESETMSHSEDVDLLERARVVLERVDEFEFHYVTYLQEETQKVLQNIIERPVSDESVVFRASLVTDQDVGKVYTFDSTPKTPSEKIVKEDIIIERSDGSTEEIIKEKVVFRRMKEGNMFNDYEEAQRVFMNDMKREDFEVTEHEESGYNMIKHKSSRTVYFYDPDIVSQEFYDRYNPM